MKESQYEPETLAFKERNWTVYDRYGDGGLWWHWRLKGGKDGEACILDEYDALVKENKRLKQERALV